MLPFLNLTVDGHSIIVIRDEPPPAQVQGQLSQKQKLQRTVWPASSPKHRAHSASLAYLSKQLPPTESVSSSHL